MDLLFNNKSQSPKEKTKILFLGLIGLGIASFISNVWSNAFQTIVVSYRQANIDTMDDITFSFLVAIVSTLIVIALGYVIYLLTLGNDRGSTTTGSANGSVSSST